MPEARAGPEQEFRKAPPGLPQVFCLAFQNTPLLPPAHGCPEKGKMPGAGKEPPAEKRKQQGRGYM